MDVIMSRSSVYQRVALSVSLAAALVGCTVERSEPEIELDLGSTTAAVSSRNALRKTKPQRPKAKHRLVVKFTDHLRVRATASGDLRSDVGSAAG
jgi:hypothetical protein